MNIVVDGRSVHQRMGGIGRVALELGKAWGSESRGHRISMLIPEGRFPGPVPDGIQPIPVDGAMIDERFDQFQLPAVLESLSADLYLNPTFSIPIVKTTKYQISFIHDIVFEDYPELVEPRLGGYLSRWSRFAAEHADHVFADSDYSVERIRRVYGMEDSRISRVYLGVSGDCFDAPSESELSRIRSKYSLGRPFILYLGSIERKKGVIELLEAYRRVLDAGVSTQLVLAGSRGEEGLNIDSEILKSGCQGNVRILGFVSEEDKKALLKLATLFVYPSLYEGFGLPPLEAMALGIPCVVSNRTSLPEVVGDAALLADVSNACELAETLRRGILDKQFRQRVAIDGPARSATFTWSAAASAILDVCERLESR